jgi:hypothetical protein
VAGKFGETFLQNYCEQFDAPLILANQTSVSLIFLENIVQIKFQRYQTTVWNPRFSVN